jgi:hypothetical protein
VSKYECDVCKHEMHTGINYILAFDDMYAQCLKVPNMPKGRMLGSVGKGKVRMFRNGQLAE